MYLYQIHPRVIRPDAAYWGLRLIAWIHAVLGAVAVIPGIPNAQRKSRLFTSHLDQYGIGPAAMALNASRGRVFLFFRLQRPPLSGWSTPARQVASASTATIIVALAAHQAGRPDLILSPKRVLAHVWKGL